MTAPKLNGETAIDVSVVIPTFNREQVLVETLDHVLALRPPAREVVVVDQTQGHEPAIENALRNMEAAGKIRWMRLTQPSITHAMNLGLQEARSGVVLFLDDDIIPGQDLVSAHAQAQRESGCNIVAGQVLQPGEEPLAEDADESEFQFCSSRRCEIREVMGGNFSVKREMALRLGGFDENFVQVAYRFEAEFCDRAIAAGEKILFEPNASIRHLKATGGGTRSFGHHLTTVRPSHAVGAYYYFLRARHVPGRFLKLISRPVRAVRTVYHLTHPWWIPGTLIAELLGFLWALGLAARGPRLIRRNYQFETMND